MAVGRKLYCLTSFNVKVGNLDYPKAVSRLMGHAKEIITMNVYGDNQNIIADGVLEMVAYMKEVLPDPEAEKRFRQELLEIVLDVSEYLPDTA